MNKEEVALEELHALAGSAISQIIELMIEVEDRMPEITEKIQQIQDSLESIS